MTRVRDPRIFLWNAQKAAGRIEEIALGVVPAAAMADCGLQEQLERNFITLGQALERLCLHCPQLSARVPRAEELAEYGEHLVRDYDRVDAADLWRRAREQAPAVRQAVQALLGELDREAGKAKDGQPAGM